MARVPAAPQALQSPQADGFQRRLGLFDATMLVAGAMIGSGIFIVSADIARDVGGAGWLLVVWALAGVITIFGALSYAELAAMMPRAGGQYVYLREAYGPLWGFLYGWTLFLVIQTGTIAAVAVAFAKFLGVLVPQLGTTQVLATIGPLQISSVQIGPLPISSGQLVAAAIIVLLTAINCIGVTAGKWVQNIFTVAKTGALALLIVVGLCFAANAEIWRANWQEPWSPIFQSDSFLAVSKRIPFTAALTALMVVGGAMVGALFSADAWHNVTFTAGETKNPQRNLPLSMTLGTGLVIALYLLANVAYLAVLPIQPDPSLLPALKRERLKESTLTDTERSLVNSATPSKRGIAYARDDRVGTAVLEVFAPNWGVPAMAVAIMISTFGCLNGLILMGPRLYYAMAQDKLFFSAIGRLNSRGVPAAGLVLQGAWSILLVFSGTYGQLLDYVIFSALLFYALTVAGLFVLRVRQPDAERPYRAVGYPWIPAIYIALCTLVMLDLLVVRPLFTWPGLCIVLAGVPVYLLWHRQPAVTS
jgi:Amino acid transporters